MELKCRQHVTLSEARRRFRASNSENLSTVLKSKSQENNIQELIDKFEENDDCFPNSCGKTNGILMEILQKSMQNNALSQVCSIVDSTTRSSPQAGKKSIRHVKNIHKPSSSFFSGNSGKLNTELG
ncbi:hypothetical protein TNCV_3473841 [Trichonephila clavipes]|nr:hypothetical protein TNCV_3473841 [Trichonephila clavipes]